MLTWNFARQHHSRLGVFHGTFSTSDLQKAYAYASLIPKVELIDGQWYAGDCRNASKARWDSKRNVFVYIRHKFGHSFDETIRHPEDDDGYDLFLPFFPIG